MIGKQISKEDLETIYTNLQDNPHKLGEYFQYIQDLYYIKQNLPHVFKQMKEKDDFGSVIPIPDVDREESCQNCLEKLREIIDELT